MNLPFSWRSMQGLHSIESGAISCKDINQKGLAHAVSEARIKRKGRSVGEIIDDHNEYRVRKFIEESEVVQQQGGVLVVGLLQKAASE